MLRRAPRVTADQSLLLRGLRGQKFGPPRSLVAAGDVVKPVNRFEYGGSGTYSSGTG